LNLKPSLNLDLKNPIEKEMEKELENSKKKKRRKQLKPAQSAQPDRAPAPPDRRTPPVSGSSPLAHALPPSLAAQWGQLVGAGFLHQRTPSHSLSCGPSSLVPSRCPRASPFLSLCRGPALSVPPSPLSSWTGECALAHVARFLGHDARPRAQLPS
jgi:hypothetical protein